MSEEIKNENKSYCGHPINNKHVTNGVNRKNLEGTDVPDEIIMCRFDEYKTKKVSNVNEINLFDNESVKIEKILKKHKKKYNLIYHKQGIKLIRILIYETDEIKI